MKTVGDSRPIEAQPAVVDQIVRDDRVVEVIVLEESEIGGRLMSQVIQKRRGREGRCYVRGRSGQAGRMSRQPFHPVAERRPPQLGGPELTRYRLPRARRSMRIPCASLSFT